MPPFVLIILSFGFGVLFVLLLFGTALYLIVTQKPVPPPAMFILRVILALAGAGTAAVLLGFITLTINIPTISVQAGGAFAVFVLIFFVNPPTLLQDRLVTLPPPKPVTLRTPPTNPPQR